MIILLTSVLYMRALPPTEDKIFDSQNKVSELNILWVWYGHRSTLDNNILLILYSRWKFTNMTLAIYRQLMKYDTNDTCNLWCCCDTRNLYFAGRSSIRMKLQDGKNRRRAPRNHFRQERAYIFQKWIATFDQRSEVAFYGISSISK